MGSTGPTSWVTRVWAAEAVTSEIAAARWESGNRPSLVASHEAVKCRQEDCQRGRGESRGDRSRANVEGCATGMEEESSDRDISRGGGKEFEGTVEEQDVIML